MQAGHSIIIRRQHIHHLGSGLLLYLEGTSTHILGLEIPSDYLTDLGPKTLLLRYLRINQKNVPKSETLNFSCQPPHGALRHKPPVKPRFAVCGVTWG